MYVFYSKEFVLNLKILFSRVTHHNICYILRRNVSLIVYFCAGKAMLSIDAPASHCFSISMSVLTPSTINCTSSSSENFVQFFLIFAQMRDFHMDTSSQTSSQVAGAGQYDSQMFIPHEFGSIGFPH